MESKLEPIEQKEPSSVLMPEDEEDRKVLWEILAIMNKQGAAGKTQSMDYRDAILYRENHLERDKEKKEEEPTVGIEEVADNILFDFDGVLFDSSFAMYRAVEIVLHEMMQEGIPIPSNIEEIANSYSAPYQDYYKRFGIEFKTLEEKKKFEDLYRYTIVPQIEAEAGKPSQLYGETLEVLHKLQGLKEKNPKIKIMVVSASDEKSIKSKLSATGVLEFFDEIYFDQHNKTEAIKKIIGQGGDSGRVAMIGDLPSDLKDAKEAGKNVVTIAIARGEREAERLAMYHPTYLINDLNGLFALKK